MVLCAVATCNTRSGRDKNVGLFHFPKNPAVRRAWIFKCQRKNYKPSKYARICEKHFVESDFVTSRSFAASIGYNRQFPLRLKPEAIPSVFPAPKNSFQKRKSPRKSTAMEKRHRLEVSNLEYIAYLTYNNTLLTNHINRTLFSQVLCRLQKT